MPYLRQRPSGRLVCVEISGEQRQTSRALMPLFYILVSVDAKPPTRSARTFTFSSEPHVRDAAARSDAAFDPVRTSGLHDAFAVVADVLIGPHWLAQDGLKLFRSRFALVAQIDLVVLAVKGEVFRGHHCIVKLREDRPLIVVAADVKRLQ